MMAPLPIFGQKPVGPMLRHPDRKVVVFTGSRSWRDEELITAILLKLKEKSPCLKVVHGACKEGADAIVEKACKILWIAQERYPVTSEDWKQYGLAAGPMRNKKMLETERPDLVVALWDGKSRGTKDTIDMAKKMGYPVRVWREQNRGADGRPDSTPARFN